MLVVNFKEFFTISSYEVVEYWSRTENGKNIDEYEVMLYNENVSQTENVMIKFKKVSDEIVVEKVQTLSYFDQQRPKHPCKICGSEMMAKENSSEETEVYVHDCSFNGEEIEDCLRELVQNELLQDGFTQEEFERNYGVNYRDESNKEYGFYDAQQRNTFYTIFNDSVYHTSYAGPQELHCKFCGMDEELLVVDGAFYQKCAVLTPHTNRIIDMIEARKQNEPNVTKRP
ncbi:hypothetical protein Bmeg_03275 [Bacillus megaterium]|jgi:hypothetical protein|uniref:hypothetical protein n=1 Tax=Priestia megaterium TaxID=1404 RepID=UPI000ACFF72D|nr:MULTISPECIES: hypothetical protein [Priestia]MCT9855553.1 hypothetical protein [Priestia megaterium]MED4088744.1 hypothetical protein [Priestia megaterium]MED4759300.1 hypothetical protein [Priestia megaterium]MUL32153.1 hypothetical protein [Priestia megaterium]